MNTLIRGFGKRALSMLLVVMMLMSLCVIGITATSAAEVDLAQTGANQAFAAGDYIYLKNFTPSGWSANWVASDVYEWIHLFNASSGATYDAKLELIEGTENAVGAIYGAKINTAGTYDHIIFTRTGGSTSPWDDERNRTGNITLDGTNNCFTNLVIGGTGYTGSVYTPAVVGEFWVDLDGNATTTIDRVYADKKGTDYYLYLPSYIETNAESKVTLRFYVSSGATLTIGGSNVSTSGSGLIIRIGATYALGGSFGGKLHILQSADVPAVFTNTEIGVPMGTYQGYPTKDDFSTKGSIVVIDENGTQLNTDTGLKKIKGRGNSSWKAAHELIGKYAFNLTLNEEAKLLDESNAAKKYCLVTHNIDEARMRNMVVYELAQQVGVEFTPDYEPVDFYNNGEFIGSYLLTDKVEIGDPLVDIVDLDKANKQLNPGIYDGTTTKVYGYSGGSSVNDNSTPGFYKYISGMVEPAASVYANSGFLLEFDLNERFADEPSGFISTKGQQIVCKYPEYATKKEIEFIKTVWNTAEAVMYDSTATYEELSAVIDVESFAKVYLIQELTKNLDGGATSYFVSYDGGKLRADVVWDYDWTLGQYGLVYTDRVQDGSKFIDQIDANPSEEGGWYINSKKIYGGSGFNAQAALCQNEAFWSVVTAEWNENFYSKALTISDGTVSSATALDGIMLTLYNKVKTSTALDEMKWGLIANDPVASWGSVDTGDTHDATAVSLNNWYFNRLTWMNKYIGTNGTSHNTAPYNVNYAIQPPVLSADKASYEAGETVKLTIDDVTDGSYTYTIYKDGTQVGTTTDKTYTFTAERGGTGNYTVVATSTASGKASVASAAAAVTVAGFNFEISVKAPESVTAGENIVVDVTSNAEETVTYTLLDGDRNIIETNTTGDFTIPTTAAGTAYYAVEASVVVDGETYTDAYDFDVTIDAYTLDVTVNAPATVEASTDILITAKASSSSTVTYTLYNSDGTIVETNSTGVFTIETTQDDIGKELTYYVTAATTVLGKDYTDRTEAFDISVTAVADFYTVDIYFKSTSTSGYRPFISTEGAINDLDNKLMSNDTAIILNYKNSTQTATYYWYKETVDISKANPSLYVNFVSSSYNMEANTTLTITESGAIYLGVEDLNASNTLVNMTSWSEAKRNWTKNAIHMIWDDAVQGEFTEDSALLANGSYELAYVGDANCDDSVNVKDVTYIQKAVVQLAELSDVGSVVSDVNLDGTVSVKDATAVQKRVAGL